MNCLDPCTGRAARGPGQAGPKILLNKMGRVGPKNQQAGPGHVVSARPNPFFKYRSSFSVIAGKVLGVPFLQEA